MIGFHKIHGLGNSFIFFEEMSHDLAFLKNSEAIKLLCDTNRGLGADGLVFISQPRDKKHHCKMRIFNADGTEAEMCGNAIRGAAHIFDHLHLGISPVLIETNGGVKEVSYVEVKDGEAFYKALMGKAIFDLVSIGELVSSEKRKALVWNGRTFEPVYVNVGNPHAVIFLDIPMKMDEMKSVGAWLESHANHPRRINVEFVEVLSANEANVHVWERGCGMTQACGTGACAVTAAGLEKGLFEGKVTVHMPGGDLIIEVNKEKEIFMTGPVQEVATGVLSGSLIHKLQRV
ncbi:MAG: diaminopimelate epimerase [Candidatus Rifleibacteriota bacterium]